jgi:hypothetical protein
LHPSIALGDGATFPASGTLGVVVVPSLAASLATGPPSLPASLAVGATQ